MVVPRPSYLRQIAQYMEIFPVTALLGSRQVGKTTLARLLKAKHYLDLENPRDLARLDHPQTLLESLDGTIVIDEVQRKPEIFPLLRYLVDQERKPRFLILGSASRDLIRQSSESLAGRIGYLEVGGFSIEEIVSQKSSWRDLWLRGGYPLSLLAPSLEVSTIWRQNFIQTFLERDIPQLGITIPSSTLGRFWTMISHYHGQLVNFSELSRSFAVSDSTIRRYLEILEGTFMIRLLQPWHGNVSKRLVKAPKLYLRDSGLFHQLQLLQDFPSLESSPKLGASFEGFVLEQVIRTGKIENPCFYRTHAGAELDLFWEDSQGRWGIEVKYSDSPTITPSMIHAIEDLKLTKLWVVYPGPLAYPLSSTIEVIPVTEINSLPRP